MSLDDTNSLIEQRKAKLAALRAKGIDPFKNKFTPSESCAASRARLRASVHTIFRLARSQYPISACKNTNYKQTNKP